MAIVPLLFQTGYLTIKGIYQQQENRIYTLGYPNYEVENAFVPIYSARSAIWNAPLPAVTCISL